VLAPTGDAVRLDGAKNDLVRIAQDSPDRVNQTIGPVTQPR
jgi:hypothetical protein